MEVEVVAAAAAGGRQRRVGNVPSLDFLEAILLTDKDLLS